MTPDRQFRILEASVLCTAAIFSLLATQTWFGDTATSRLATVYSLAHHGAWHIDARESAGENPFSDATIDKARLPDGRMISTKPPILPLLMTAQYLVINRVSGLDLADAEDRPAILWWLSVTFVAAGYVAALVFFLLTLRWVLPPGAGRLVLLGGLAFGTQLWGYSDGINNHVPAAALIAAALYLSIGLATGNLEPRWWRFGLFGLVGALAVTIDMPGGVYIAAAGLTLLYLFPRETLLFVLPGAAMPLAAHFTVMVTVTGSPWPVQTRPELYLYEWSYWRHPRGVDALAEPKGLYLFNMTLGSKGVFSLYPILLVGPAAAVAALVSRGMPWRRGVLLGAAAFALLTAYYVATTNNYGGEAYGFRWHIISMPVLMLMGAPLVHVLRKPWHWAPAPLLLAFSFHAAWECTRSPWTANAEWLCRFLGPVGG